MKPKVWGAEAVSGWEEEEEEEEEEERSEMRSKGEPGSQQPTMEGRGPRQVNFFLILASPVLVCRHVSLQANILDISTHLKGSNLLEKVHIFYIG